MKNLIVITVYIILSIIKSFAQQPDYKVVFLDEYYTHYINQAKNNSEDLKQLHRDQIQIPIFQKYFMQSEYASFIYQDLSNQSLNLQYLKKSIHGITSNKKKIEKMIIKSLQKCNTFLKTDEMNIYVIPPSSSLQEMIQKMGGIMGFTAGGKQILISIDTNIEGWEQLLQYAIAHEYNHAYWTKETFTTLTRWTLLDYLIFEGKADYFAKFLYPNAKTPWTEALTTSKKQGLWQNLLPHLQNQDFGFHTEVMFGSQKYPTWGGYSLGYDIVQSFLASNKSIPPKTWIRLTSEEVLEESSYN